MYYSIIVVILIIDITDSTVYMCYVLEFLRIYINFTWRSSIVYYRGPLSFMGYLYSLQTEGTVDLDKL